MTASTLPAWKPARRDSVTFRIGQRYNGRPWIVALQPGTWNDVDKDKAGNPRRFKTEAAAQARADRLNIETAARTALSLHPFVGTGTYCEHVDVEAQGDDAVCGWERSDHEADAALAADDGSIPECPNGHGPMVLRTDPTPMQAEQGTWYDCPPGPAGSSCMSSTLIPNA